MIPWELESSPKALSRLYSSPMNIELLELQNLKKTFGNKVVNDGINLSLKAGDVVGLLGENGAGKTTLMNMIYGLYQPDGGQILINGKPVRFKSPRDARKAGIGMVHQHFMLVPSLSILDNITAADADAPFFAPGRASKKKLAALEKHFALDFPLSEKAWNLSAGQLQRVEIAKALINGARLLILDEPTSVLSPQEAEELFALLKKLASDGMIIIMISHKLDEILSLCTQVMVLKKGMIAGFHPTAGADRKELARLMIGKDVSFTAPPRQSKEGELILAVEGLSTIGDRGELAVENVSFQVHQYEIFGIAGVSGNGQRELAEAITGLRNASAGRVYLDGHDVTNKPVKNLSGRGLAHIPEERMRFGIVPNLLLYENAVLKDYHTDDFAGDLFIKYPKVKDFADMIVENFRVSTPGIHTPLKNLSGGNIQKLILGREISGDPTLLVASHPTYGLDVGATQYVREQLLHRRETGGAILLLSEDLEEVLELADRVAVMFKGRFMGILARGQADAATIGLMMAGSTGAQL